MKEDKEIKKEIEKKEVSADLDKKNLKELVSMMINNQNKLIEEKKVKKFWMPFKGRLGKAQLRKNYVTVFYIQDNKELMITKVPIQEGTLMIKDSPYLATAKYMLTYKGKPAMIIPSWNTEPFCADENKDKAIRDATVSEGYRLMLNNMKNQAISATKKKVNWIMILIIIGVAALGFYLFNNPNFKIF